MNRIIIEFDQEIQEVEEAVTLHPRTLESIRREIDRIMRLLIIGVRNVCPSVDTDEAIIMREARQSLESLYRFVGKQIREETST